MRSHGDEVAQLGPGDIVGEAAILNHSLRTATIVALTPLELIHFTKEQLDRLNVEMPSFHEALEKTAAERFPHNREVTDPTTTSTSPRRSTPSSATSSATPRR